MRPASDDMSRRKGDSMTNELGRSNMPPSPHLSFSTSGGMGKSTSIIIYKRLAHLLSFKR